ncbi:cytochrome P450 [Trametes maxima]|nr:cytochrome P450 [Trametes maxima]
MITVGQTFLALLIATAGWAVWKLWSILARPYTTALRNLPGPPSPSWIFGNMKAIQEEEESALQERWAAEYGPNITYRGFLNRDWLWTLDTRALNHILTHSAEYRKPDETLRSVVRIVGEGVFFTEGEHHRKQRRVMNPAFGPSQIRELTSIFVDKSIELRDMWEGQIGAQNTPTRVDALKGLSMMTLDVIGLAGFNYRFDSLSSTGTPNELSEAFQAIFSPPAKPSVLMILKHLFPIFDIISRRVDRAREVMRRIGSELIQEKKTQIQRELAENKSGGSSLERKDVQGRDLLTLLLKANMATDIPDSQRLSDEDVLAQVPTFIVAGHETTSTATTWCLFALTQAPAVQAKLRAELLAVDTNTPTMEELNALPYLDAVVRETLRIHSPVATTVRVAARDDVIPVDRPFVDRFGEVQDSIRISKGSPIIIPILSLNRSKQLWGKDALEFKPERWDSTPEAVSSVPGVWGHMLSFLGGPRACIGYRFSLVEMKALIFVLVRAFEFELAVPLEDLQKKSNVVQRPLLRSAPEQGSQMPLLLKRTSPWAPKARTR